jgi:hypothetical protein
MGVFTKTKAEGWHTVHATLTDYEVYVDEAFLVSGMMTMPRATLPEPWKDKYTGDVVYLFQASPKSGGPGNSHSFCFDDISLCEIERQRFVTAAKLRRP